ncbi:MAG: hypothetical protein SF172_00920 [Burkholderiales bacterium]|nr:hypothetical protein [Burkholderiales bacterium]
MALVLLWLAGTRVAHAGTVSGRVTVGATVVSSCAWRTHPVDGIAVQGAVRPTVASRCTPGVNFTASIHADDAVAQAVQLERFVVPATDAHSPVLSPPALRREETAVPVRLPGWGGIRPTYVTITY